MIRAAAILLLLITTPALAEDCYRGGRLCDCVTRVCEGDNPLVFGEPPPVVDMRYGALIALPEAEDKARAERIQAIIAGDRSAHPYSGRRH